MRAVPAILSQSPFVYCAQSCGLLVLVCVGLSACTSHSEEEVTTALVHIEATAQGQTDNHSTASLPAILFTDTVKNLGIIAEGNAVEVEFAFVNSGTSALVLADVSTSCGCTVANDWPKTPIAPGAGATINVRFDSQGRTGENRKEISVISNTTPSTTILVLMADVIGPTH